MLGPGVGPRVKEGHQGLGDRIQRGNVGALEAITVKARPCQVLQRARSTMFERNDMIRLVWEEGIGFRQQAILTAARRAGAYLATQGRRDRELAHTGRSI